MEFLSLTLRAKQILWLKHVITASTVKTGKTKEGYQMLDRERQASYATQPEVALRLMEQNGKERRVTHWKAHRLASPSYLS